MHSIEHATSLITDANTLCWYGLVTKKVSSYAPGGNERTSAHAQDPGEIRVAVEQLGTEERKPTNDSTRVSNSKLAETLALYQADIFLLSHSKIKCWASPEGHG